MRGATTVSLPVVLSTVRNVGFGADPSGVANMAPAALAASPFPPKSGRVPVPTFVAAPVARFMV